MGTSYEAMVARLFALSQEQVIIRGRQWPKPSGTGSDGRSSWTTYRLETEVEVLATYNDRLTTGTERGVILLRLNKLGCSGDQQIPLVDDHWINEDCESGFSQVFDSWTEVPLWIQAKPIVLCRMQKPDEEYTPAATTDPIFLRWLECVRAMALSREKEIWDMVGRISPRERTREMRNRHRMIGLIAGHRLDTFLDQRYDELAKLVGTAQVQIPKNR